MLSLVEPYKTRPIRFVGYQTFGNWRMKTYGISYTHDKPRQELFDAVAWLAPEVLPEPAITDTRYGVGYVGVHEGRNSNFIFFDWWENENELHHKVFTGTATDLVQDTTKGLCACVWDLAVIGFERDAWVEKVLKGGGDIEGYLATQLNAEV